MKLMKISNRHNLERNEFLSTNERSSEIFPFKTAFHSSRYDFPPPRYPRAKKS